MLALAVMQLDASADPAAALAAVPGAMRFLLRPPELDAGAAPAGVQLLAVDTDERAAAAELVWRASGAEVVVVLQAGEVASADLAAALAALPGAGDAARFAATRVHRFLGREVTGEPAVIAWRGEPGAAGAPIGLAGRLVVVEPDITTAIARLDGAATRAARRRRAVAAADFIGRPMAALARRLWMRRRDGVPGAVLAVLETYAEIVAAAKAWEREERVGRAHAAASSRAVPRGFTALDTRAGFVVVRDDVREPLLPVLLDATPEIVAGEPLTSGGRGATWSIALGGHGRAVLRWYRRGGVLRHFMRDRYFGWRPRPLVELTLTDEARRRGIAVPEVLGVRVDRLRAGYRGAIVTREIAGAETLGEAARRDPSGAERLAIVTGVARAVRAMHEHGLHHRDLNVGNILVSRAAAGLDVHVIDLDRARLRTPVSVRARRRALRRLARSVAKLASAMGEGPRADDRAAFHRAYRERP